MNTRKFICSICSASADGVHYGALSCRSCNAFFRRSVVENVEYRCKYLKKCVIDTEARCSCRFCRFHKCLAAGMKPAAVQPRRDPTGTQKNRFKKSLGSPLETFHSGSSSKRSISTNFNMGSGALSLHS
ncbi:unnamed protein product [Auanema sp. JU1783]|nr:unnamed protein product [Auanema sp. JU1783]